MLQEPINRGLPCEGRDSTLLEKPSRTVTSVTTLHYPSAHDDMQVFLSIHSIAA